jgi:arylsulfatase A-like enzyme
MDCLRLTLIVGLVMISCTAQQERRGRPTRPAFSPPPNPPNVVVIVTDDQRAQHTLRVMPATRRLFVDGGTRFTRAYATTPLCCPSRASIFTGRYAHSHGVVRNELGDQLDPESMLPSYLREAGYLSAVAGKYLQGVPIGYDPPNFDRWDTFSWGYFDRFFNVDGRLRLIHRYATDHLASSALRFLHWFEERDSKPWFLYIAPSAPHKPYTAEVDYARAKVPVAFSTKRVRELDRSDKPAYVRKSRFAAKEGRDIFVSQLRSLLSVDDLVGRLFRALDRLGERDTLAFFLSDNGFMLGEHGLFAKRLPYTASVQIPLLMRWPGQVNPGVTADDLVANIDIAPTILHAAGVAPKERFPIDGMSLLEPEFRDRLLLEEEENIHGLPDWASLLTRTYQYIEYYAGDGDVVEREYYNLTSDPRQLDNLLADGDETNDPGLTTLQDRLARDRNCRGAACP